jgi:phosphoserine phosphatase
MCTGGSACIRQLLGSRHASLRIRELGTLRARRAGIAELVEALQNKGTAVALVSGGFRQIIEPIADTLGIPFSHVHANMLKFGEDGAYAGFNDAEFTSRSGGKLEAVKHLKEKHGYETVVIVGDGATDLEARADGGADAFVCYGGAVMRENVARAADWVVTEIQPLINAL